MTRILTQKNPANLIALYCFLLHTANRQRTQIVYATELFISRGLRWSEAKTSYVKKQLRDMGLLESVTRRNKSGQLAKHYLRLNYSANQPVPKFTGSGEIRDNACNSNLNAVEERSEETSAVADASFSSTAGKKVPAVWKPDVRGREEKLAALVPPRQFPSEREFDDFLDSEYLFGIGEHRPGLYRDLCLHKWRDWDDRLNKWTLIRSWKKYVAALDEKILASSNHRDA